MSIPDLERTFAGAGLAIPRVQPEFALSLQRITDWWLEEPFDTEADAKTWRRQHLHAGRSENGKRVSAIDAAREWVETQFCEDAAPRRRRDLSDDEKAAIRSRLDSGEDHVHALADEFKLFLEPGGRPQGLDGAVAHDGRHVFVSSRRQRAGERGEALSARGSGDEFVFESTLGRATGSSFIPPPVSGTRRRRIGRHLRHSFRRAGFLR